MPRQLGSRVIDCNCGGKVVGMPGQVRRCSFCDAKVRITTKPAEKKNNVGHVNRKVSIKVTTKARKAPAFSATKKAIKKVTKKRSNNAQQSSMA